MPKFHIIRVFDTAFISLVGFALTRSFQDGGQKHGKTKSNRIQAFCGVFTVNLTVLKHLPIQIPVINLNQSRTNGPINAHLTIAQVMPRYNHNNEKQEALL